MATSQEPLRPAPQKQPLSLGAIIAASVRVADTEGLAGVSIRRVAAVLKAAR